MPASPEWRSLLTLIHESAELDASNEVLPRVLALGQDTAPAVVGCSLTEFDGVHFRTPAASADIAVVLDEAQYADSAGPCVSAAREGRPYHLPDLSAESRFPAFTAAALRRGVRSSLSLPVVGCRQRTALNLYSTAEGAFEGDRPFAVAALVARTVSTLLARPSTVRRGTSAPAAEARARTAGAHVTDAVGALMRRDDLSQAAAFGALVARSRDQQIPLLSAADEVLTVIGGGREPE